MANQIVVSAGAKVRNLGGVLTATSGVVSSVPLGAANGVATLDSGGKVPVSQLPSSVVTYLGTWNAATNTPTLVNGVGDAGDMYICNVAGTVNFGAGPVTFAVGDWVLYGSGTWEKSNGQNGTVTSVAVTESGDSLNITGSPIVNSGTINIGFNGTNLQYVNGAGNLTTFPDLTGFVPYTGATANVDLGTFNLTADVITGATGSFASSGGSDTFAINHSSGSGIALNITKGGNGEGLYINKTSGSGNAATIIGTLNATTLVKSGGTSSQFLKADGTVDSTAYQSALTLTTTGTSGAATLVGATLNIPDYGSALSGYLPLTGGTLTGALSGTTATFSGAIESSSYIQSKLGASASIGLGSRFQWDNSLTGVSQKQLSLQMNAAFGLDLWYFNGSTYNNTGIKFNIDGSINGKSFVSNGALLDSDIAANKTFIDNNNGARFLSYGPNSTTRGSILFYQGSSANTLGQYALTIDASGNSVFIGTISATNFSGTSSGTNTGDQSLASLGAQPQLNGTGFVKASGTTISYDNTSYLPLTGGTLTGALNINLSSGTAMNVAGNAIFRGDTGVGTPRQLIITSGGSTPVYLEAKGYGANYQTDFGIRTFNNVGTSFEVFYADSSGRVGINRVAPSFQLDVNGTGRFEGALRVNGGTTTIYGSSEARLNFNTDVDGEQNSSWLYSDSNATLGSIGNVYIQALSTTVLSVLDFNNYGNNTANGVTGNVFIGTSVAQGIDKGAVLSLGGWTTSTGSPSAFGRIAGRKENATSGNQAGYLSFETANALVSQSTEKMRITSTGSVGIGNADAGTNGEKLKVSGAVYINAAESNTIFTSGAFLVTPGTYNNFRQTTSHDLVIDTYNGGSIITPFTLKQNGNVLIGTTTDGGGKLQVNGEIRMYGSTLFRGMSSNTLQLCGGTSSSNVKIDGSVEVVTIDTNGATRLTIGSNGFIQATNTTQTDDLGTIQIYNTTASAFANSSLTVKSYNGTGQFMQWENYGMRIGSRIKTNTGAGGIYFTYGNDSVGLTIKSTGVINFSNVPTSSSGLSSGDIYKSAGVLMIV
jgi:hypothetical protein